ncbi:unnamed protein product [Sphagnum balticum]
MALLTSSAPKAAEDLQAQIFRISPGTEGEKQLHQQQQELCRDHRYEVSNRSIKGGLHHLCSYLLGILT